MPMRTSDPGVPDVARLPPGAWRGFTLVELLVVLLVLSTATALIAVRLFETEQQRGQKAAEALRDALAHAALAAQWQGRNLLWRSEFDGWRFFTPAARAEENAWRPIDSEPSLAPRLLPPQMRITEFRRSGQASRDLALIFTAQGINDPFDIVLGLAEQTWRLRGDALGRVELDRP
ncbi:hypothetical protein MYXO_03263 [Myxococcaceae bacterium]|nr:hypothetical protein MYXO_03263 [Myxococcaceae bacterium]